MAEDQYQKGLKGAMQIGMYYAYLAQALRMVINPEGPAELSEEVLRDQLDRIRGELIPLLAGHRVVKENVEEVARKVSQIRKAASKQATWGEAVKEARRYLPEVEIRARTVGDIVAILHRF